MTRDWWDMSRRLRRFLMTSPCVYGYIWIEECGNWKVCMIKVWDAYIEGEIKMASIKIDNKVFKVPIEVAALLQAVSEERDELRDLNIWLANCCRDKSLMTKERRNRDD